MTCLTPQEVAFHNGVIEAVAAVLCVCAVWVLLSGLGAWLEENDSKKEGDDA